MGVRPQGYIIFGVDDVNFEPECYDIYEFQIDIPKSDKFEDLYLRDCFYDKQYEELKLVNECLYRSEGSDVFGLIISKTKYDSDFIRGLSVFYPRFETSEKLDFPVWDREEYHVYAKRIREQRFSGCGDIEWQWSWFYPAVVESHNMWPVHAYCARHLFNQIGLQVDYREFKAMLVWEWM